MWKQTMIRTMKIEVADGGCFGFFFVLVWEQGGTSRSSVTLAVGRMETEKEEEEVSNNASYIDNRLYNISGDMDGAMYDRRKCNKCIL